MVWLVAKLEKLKKLRSKPALFACEEHGLRRMDSPAVSDLLKKVAVLEQTIKTGVNQHLEHQVASGDHQGHLQS